jgi:hypothetical protein
MPDLRPLDPGAKLKRWKPRIKNRIPSAEKMGLTVSACVPPKLDTQHTETLFAGCQHRQACTVPPVTATLKEQKELRRFVFLFLKKFVSQLKPEDVESYEVWAQRQKDDRDSLDRANKEQEKYLPGQKLPERFTDAACFGKDEHYPEVKPARGIAGRSLHIKCRYGRFMAALDRVLGKLKFLVKGLNASEIRGRMLEMFRTTDEFAENDFSSFEASITTKIIRLCECQLFRHVFQHVMPKELVDEICNDAAGKHVFRYKGFSVTIAGRRRSGDLWTSSGNAFTNLMLICFCLWKMGITFDQMRVLVEGDDSIVQIKDIETYCGLFERISGAFGFRSKVCTSPMLATTSFLQKRTTPDGRYELKDWRKILATFGWSKQKHVGMSRAKLLVLFRARSYSLAYQFPRHPILYALAKSCLRLTAGVKLPMEWLRKQLDLYEFEVLERSVSFFRDDRLFEGDDMCPPPDLAVRSWYALCFATPVNVQLYLEQLLLSQTDPFATLFSPVLNSLMDPLWFETYNAMCSP